jgi:acyl carrier protein
VNEQELLQLFGETLGEILGRDAVTLTMTTRREDVPDWDSFSYVNFIVAVEMRLGVRFRVGELESFGTVGAIVRRSRDLLAEGARGNAV